MQPGVLVVLFLLQLAISRELRDHRGLMELRELREPQESMVLLE